MCNYGEKESLTESHNCGTDFNENLYARVYWDYN